MIGSQGGPLWPGFPRCHRQQPSDLTVGMPNALKPAVILRGFRTNQMHCDKSVANLPLPSRSQECINAVVALGLSLQV